MDANAVIARIGGAVALAGSFYTAYWITSWPGGAPGIAVLGLLAGTAAGFLAFGMPRSAPALSVAILLLLLAFVPATIGSGAAFLPGLMIVGSGALRMASGVEGGVGVPSEEQVGIGRLFGEEPDDDPWSVEEPDDLWSVAELDAILAAEADISWTEPVGDPWPRRSNGSARSTSWGDEVVQIPEADDEVVIVPAARDDVVVVQEAGGVSSDGRVWVGPPGVIGVLGPRSA